MGVRLRFFQGKRRVSLLIFLCLGLLLVLLWQSRSGEAASIYLAHVDRVVGEVAIVIIEEINAQCSLTEEGAFRALEELEQNWVWITYEEEEGSCQLLEIDLNRTEQVRQEVEGIHSSLKNRRY